MEEAELLPHPDYIKGFNEGYLLSEALPEIADKLSAALGQSDRSMGIKDGRQQYIQERTKELMPRWLSTDISSSEPGLDPKSREKDGSEPDFEKT